jgi:hypothetical protein
MAKLSWPKAKTFQRAKQAAQQEREDIYLLASSRFGTTKPAAYYAEISNLTRRINTGRQMIAALPYGDPNHEPWRKHLRKLIADRRALQLGK